MTKLSATCAFCVVVAIALCALPLRSAHAYQDFSKAFFKKYVGEGQGSNDVQKSIAKEFKRVKKCAVCHDPRPGSDGKLSKKNRNPYGAALNKLLTKKEQKDEAKALEALAKIEAEKVEGAEKTFGEQLAAGKLPFLYDGFDYAGGKDDGKDDDKD